MKMEKEWSEEALFYCRKLQLQKCRNLTLLSLFFKISPCQIFFLPPEEEDPRILAVSYTMFKIGEYSTILHLNNILSTFFLCAHLTHGFNDSWFILN